MCSLTWSQYWSIKRPWFKSHENKFTTYLFFTKSSFLNVNLCRNIFEIVGKFNKYMKMELTKRIEKVEKWVDLEMLNFGQWNLAFMFSSIPIQCPISLIHSLFHFHKGTKLILFFLEFIICSISPCLTIVSFPHNHPLFECPRGVGWPLIFINVHSFSHFSMAIHGLNSLNEITQPFTKSSFFKSSNVALPKGDWNNFILIPFL